MSSVEPEVVDAEVERLASSEVSRKAVHIAFGFAAIALYWLPWSVALAVAAAAVVFNWLILPWVGGRHISRDGSRSDAGILLYPIAVFTLILLFPDHRHIAGAVWVILAFGDGCATLIGRNVKGPRLPWNRRKSLYGTLAFIEVGLPAAYFITLWLGPNPTVLPLFIVITIASCAAAAVESLDLGIDDNITVPLVAAFTLWWLEQWRHLPAVQIDSTVAAWLLANVIFASAGYVLRSVDAGGWIGGILLGSILILWGGWPAYVVLLLFFMIGTGVTKIGFASKARRGLAQEKGGRRGFHHAFANVGVAAICVLSIATTAYAPNLLWIGAVGALATAAADTTSSELGKLWGRRTFLPLTFRRVEPGTDGAISIEGTVAGAVAGAIVAFAGVLLLAWKSVAFETLQFGTGVTRAVSGLGVLDVWSAVVAVTIAAIIGSWLESVVGSLFRRVSNGALNFFNTVTGALLAMALIRIFQVPV